MCNLKKKSDIHTDIKRKDKLLIKDETTPINTVSSNFSERFIVTQINRCRAPRDHNTPQIRHGARFNAC